MSDFNDDRYKERKDYFMKKLEALAGERDGSIEDDDAFDNALEDFDYTYE